MITERNPDYYELFRNQILNTSYVVVRCLKCEGGGEVGYAYLAHEFKIVVRNVKLNSIFEANQFRIKS